MGFFNRNFDRPGPGVEKDTPRKKGLPRFFELLGRDFGSFFKANLLCAAASIPAAFFVSFGLFSNSILFIIGGGIIGGMILAPCWAGMHDTVLRAMRDEPGYWWHTYKRAMKNNWKQSIAPGALCGLLISSQLCVLWMVLQTGMQLTIPMVILISADVLITGMCTPFLWGQLVLMDMSFPMVLKNSLLFALANAPRALLLAFIQVIYWGAVFLFMPVTSFLVLLFGFALITLITQMIAYPAMDKVMGLEEKFKALRAEQEKDLQGPSDYWF